MEERIDMLPRGIGALVITLIVGSLAVTAQEQLSRNIASHLKVVGFTMGKDTIADVQAKLGKSPVRKCSREEGASQELCYVSMGKNPITLVFQSGFSGGWKELDGYKIIAGYAPSRCYKHCARTTLVASEIRTEGGLRLGLTRAQLIALLGSPKQVRGNKLSFGWKSRQAMTKEQIESTTKTFKSPVDDPYYDVQDTIQVTLAGSKVVAFEVHHTVTY